MGPTWGPPGSCGPQMGPMLAPWTLLSGHFNSTFQRSRYMDTDMDVLLAHWKFNSFAVRSTEIAKFMGPTWGPPGSCGPQMGPMLAPWTLLSGHFNSTFQRSRYMDTDMDVLLAVNRSSTWRIQNRFVSKPQLVDFFIYDWHPIKQIII